MASCSSQNVQKHFFEVQDEAGTRGGGGSFPRHKNRQFGVAFLPQITLTGIEPNVKFDFMNEQTKASMSVSTDGRGTWKGQMEYKRPRTEISVSGIRGPDGNSQASITAKLNLGGGNPLKKKGLKSYQPTK